jgi:hypothetical protein
MFIYLIVNSVTGKYYVGQHKGNNLKQYLQQKFWESQHKPTLRSRLYASMRKHPQDAWSIHPLVSTLTTKAELDYWEGFFIAQFKSRNREHGYNICRGGEGFTGPHSEETKVKMSKTRKGRSNPWAIGNTNAVGRAVTPEQIEASRQRMKASSLASLGAKALWGSLTPEQRAERCAKTRAGKKQLPESISGDQDGKFHIDQEHQLPCR